MPGLRRGAPEARGPGGDRGRPQHPRGLPAVGRATRSRFFAGLELSDTQAFIGARVIQEISERLRFLDDVGVGYLTLARAAGTLSGGEAQRIRLATQIGSGLVGVLYILDEPSIGLHQRDNRKLIGTLERLRDQGNTVLVVEHDEEMIRAPATSSTWARAPASTAGGSWRRGRWPTSRPSRRR